MSPYLRFMLATLAVYLLPVALLVPLWLLTGRLIAFPIWLAVMVPWAVLWLWWCKSAESRFRRWR